MKTLYRSLIILITALTVVSEKCREPIPPMLSPQHVKSIVDSLILHQQDLFSPVTLAAFYSQRDYHLVWNDHNYQRDSILAIIRDARLAGLYPEEYHLQELDSLQKKIRVPTIPMRDVLLTDAFFKLAWHLKHGRINATTITIENRLEKVDTALMTALESAVKNHGIMDELKYFEPQNIQYAELKDVLRDKLYLYENILFSDEERNLLSAEIQKVAINIERWRWQGEMPARYLLVNIPSFTLDVLENNQVVLTSRVITGLPDKQTPLLESNIECIVIYPYWHVPRSIATKELLPIIQRNPRYLEANNFDVLNSKGRLVDPATLNWQIYNRNFFPYTLRQREGTDNALGVIKFQFDNAYGVYLHDTNAKKLFQKNVRALSHGCVRAEGARELATYLVEHDGNNITRKKLDQLLAAESRREINLKKPLPIYIRYFTADREGIYADIYKKDEPLLTLFQHFVPAEINAYRDDSFSRYALNGEKNRLNDSMR